MKTAIRFLAASLAINVWSVARTQEPPFLEWNIQMRTPTLIGGSSVLLKNLKKPGKFMGSSQRDSFATGTVVAGINLHWWAGVAGEKGEYTDVRFEIAPPPGKMSDPSQNAAILYRTPVAIKVGYRGYLRRKDTRFGIDMDFSATPVYEWHVINLAPVAEGITGNQKVALLNKSKGAFLVYESRRIGFELGWYKYSGPRPPQGSPQALTYKSNIEVFQNFIEQLQQVNGGEARFLRTFFNVPRKP